MTPTTSHRAMAFDLCRRYGDVLGEKLLLAGVYGSVARGTATATSDIEILVVTTTPAPLDDRHWLVGTCPVGSTVVDRDRLENILTTPSSTWAYHMGLLSVVDVLEGDESLLPSWLELGQTPSDEAFRYALIELLPSLVWESWGRVHSCVTRADDGPLHLSAVEVLGEIATALCLLNRSFVTHDYLEGLRDTYSFPRRPIGWSDLVEALWRARTGADVLRLTDEVVAAFRTLLDREGVACPVFSSIQSLPL